MTITTPVLPTTQGDDAYQLAALTRFSQLMSGATTLLIPLIVITGANNQEIMVAVLLSAASWLSLFMVMTGQAKHVPRVMIASMIGLACVAVIASGSVRSAVTVLFLGGVVASGVFLNRNALIGAVAFSVAAIGLLTWAETQGVIKPHMSQVGMRDWIVLAMAMVLMGYLVYFSRTRSEHALQRQRLEFEQRKSLEEERDQIQKRFARIFRMSPSPILVQSASTLKLLDVNPAFERCFGYTKDQILSKDDVLLWADPEARDQFFELVLRHKRVSQHKTQGRRADGERFDVVISCEVGMDEEDPLIITTVTDISQHNRVMKHLQKSEERFAKAFNFIPLTLFISRVSDGLILEVHSPRNSLVDIDIDAIRGKTSLEAGLWLNERERQVFESTLLREGCVNGMETQFRGHEGTPFNARIWGERIELDDEDCVLSCVVNTTVEKQRESQLRELAMVVAGQTNASLLQELCSHICTSVGADIVLVGAVVDDLQVQTLVVCTDGVLTPNFVCSIQDTPCEQAMLVPDLCVYPSDVSQRFAKDPLLAKTGIQAYVGQSLRSTQSEHIGVLAVMWRQPTEITSDIRALITICASRVNGELQRFHHEKKIHDLNLNLEQKVAQRTSELEKLNAELDAFAYSVSHDLKSPLRAIDGFSQLMLEQFEGRSTEAERDTMKRILAATHRMSNLIKDLLALARISQSALNLREVNLSATAEEVLRQLGDEFPKRQRELHIAPGLFSRCDPNLAHIALTNLLHNALKYTRDQPLPVIEFGQLPGSEAAPVFFVRDNGAGFDMVHADKLFKPFQRLHMPSAGFEGSGIGLATVRRILDRHNGTLRAEARVGQGATLFFSFGPSTPSPRKAT